MCDRCDPADLASGDRLRAAARDLMASPDADVAIAILADLAVEACVRDLRKAVMVALVSPPAAKVVDQAVSEREAHNERLAKRKAAK